MSVIPNDNPTNTLLIWIYIFFSHQLFSKTATPFRTVVRYIHIEINALHKLIKYHIVVAHTFTIGPDGLISSLSSHSFRLIRTGRVSYKASIEHFSLKTSHYMLCDIHDQLGTTPLIETCVTTISQHRISGHKVNFFTTEGRRGAGTDSVPERAVLRCFF